MEPTTDRRTVKAASIAAICLFAPLLLPVVSGRVFSMGDLSDFHLPLRHLYESALVEGHSILWTNRLFAGFYVHAEGQVGAFHPLHIVLYRLLPLTIAFNLELVASYIFCFAGMWFLLRRFGFPAAASLTGAIAFTFSGFNLLHLLHLNAIATVAHVPWLLLALEGVLFGDPRRRSRSVLGLSTLTGSILLLGYPQYVWMAALICAIFVAVQIRQASLQSLGIAIGGAVAGVMLGGVQLLPTIDLLHQSVRQAIGSDFSLTYSLHPLNVAQLFSPYLLSNRVYAAPDELFVHEFGIYNGVFCTLAGMWVLMRWRRVTFKREALFAVALIGVGLVMALGRYGLVYEGVAALPLVGKFRAPARHIALVHFGLALLAAVALDDLRRSSADQRRTTRVGWIWLPLALSIGFAFVSWWWISVGKGFEGQSVDPVGAFVSAVLVLIVTLRLTDAWRGSKTALAGLPVILSLDLGLWGYGYVLPGGMETVEEIARRAEIPASESTEMLHAAEAASPNLALLSGFGVVRPYVGLYPDRVLPLASANELRVSGVEWVQTREGWERVADPMPRVRTVPEALVASEPVAETSRVDVRRVAIVDTVLPALDADAAAVAVADSPGRITIDVMTQGHALLATTEAYHAGWTATSEEGRELQTVRVYGDYLGVLLAPGQYQLVLAFEPPSFRAGSYLSAAGLVCLLAIAAAARRPRVRTDNATSTLVPEEADHAV